MAGITILTLVGGLSGLVGAASPTSSTLTDILGGQRHLLRNDDVVLDVAPSFQTNLYLTQGLQPDAQKVPLHVVFSGPDQITQIRIDGNQLEWYQPVQEPGNVFSYPWNITQLQNLYAGFNALTEDPATVWATDSSASTVSTTWSEGAGSSVTSGSVSTQAFDVSVSIASKINIGGFGADLSGGFDYNSSSSVSTLNESSSKLGSSTGIKIVKPSFVNPGQYAYTAQTSHFRAASTHRHSARDSLGHHGAVQRSLVDVVSGRPHRHTQWRRGVVGASLHQARLAGYCL